MLIAVKWVYQSVRMPNGGRVEAGQKPALCFKGHKHMLCVSAGFPVRALKRPVADYDKMRDVVHDGANYTVERAVKKLKEIARRNGVTKAAKRLLERALLAKALTEAEEQQLEDEEDSFIETKQRPRTQEKTTMTTETPASNVAPGTGSNGSAGALKARKATSKGSQKAPRKTVAARKAGPRGKASAKGKKSASKSASGAGVPREGSIARTIYDGLKAGKSVEALAKIVKRENTYVSWYRWQFVKRGILKASK